MKYYVYDDTFDDFLSLIYDTYSSKNPEDIIISKRKSDLILLQDKIYIDYDQEKSDKVLTTILTKTSPIFFKNLIYCFFSELDNIENNLFLYIKNGIKFGKNCDKHLEVDNVRYVNDTSSKVGFEVHRMQGLLRFKKLKNDIFYGPYEPDYNISIFLINHFKKRLGNQKWIIHDLKRNILFYFNGENVEEITYEAMEFDEDFFQCEDASENMWKLYHKSISIAERKNLKLQKQYMPKRYWKYLTEKN